MFEDIIIQKKKLVCKKCGSDDIGTGDKVPCTPEPSFEVRFRRYRQFARCYSCNCTYYITKTVWSK